MDADSNIIHSLEATTVKIHDNQVLDGLLHDKETTVRAKIEHPFRFLKRQFGHVKTRYLGQPKNRAHLFTLFKLGNLFPMRQSLIE